MESSRRDLLNSVAEHRVILENEKKRDTPDLVSLKKAGVELRKITGVSFLL